MKNFLTLPLESGSGCLVGVLNTDITELFILMVLRLKAPGPGVFSTMETY